MHGRQVLMWMLLIALVGLPLTGFFGGIGVVELLVFWVLVPAAWLGIYLTWARRAQSSTGAR